MKKLLSFLLIMFAFIQCSNEENNSDCSANLLRGKLAIKGICLNYTIQLVSGEIDKDLIESEWVDEMTGTDYNDVFALQNVCDFPSGIEEGEIFDFIVNKSPENQKCAVCLAYRPTPSKSISIIICD